MKNLKRAQDPSDGTPKGFGFCEFESAEGVLRALRLLSKLNIDGQELMVCLPFYHIFRYYLADIMGNCPFSYLLLMTCMKNQFQEKLV